METSASTVVIMIASDRAADAEQVRSLLHAEFRHVYISTVADTEPGDFVRYRPNVLVLAFDTLEKSERYYLELNRMCGEMQQQPLRTVILCNRHEIKQVYELCKKGYFDDYILFWPLTDDSSRLAMSIHHALHDLADRKNKGPSAAEFAAQARHLAELGNRLDQQIVQGGLHIDVASQALKRASQGVDTALDKFSQRLISGALPETVEVKNADGMEAEIKRLKREDVQPQFSAVFETTIPLNKWAQQLKQECAPLLKSAQTLNDMAGQIRPTVLVVDDDEVQRVIIDNLLTAHDYNLLFARDGLEALNVLRNKHPDLILMDMMMPNMNGLETTRRLKAVPEFAGTPVIMITAKSEGDVVVECMKAGATDFVVKPFDPAILVDKINQALKAAVLP
ncbi:MAG: response regulator [Gallionellaceae bacterium]|nr:response regulator [Gallionellaceae bacterium]